MLEIVKTPTIPVFFENLKNSKKKVCLCAPFIKIDIVKKILNCLNSNIEFEVITCSNIASFIREASDISAIELLLQNNVKVYNHQHLHAKIYVFDEKRALITSANLTYSGMNSNYEYGVMISDDTVIDSIVDDCECLIDDQLSGEFNFDIVNEIKEKVNYYKEHDYEIKIDKDEDDVLISDYEFISTAFSSWKKDIFDIIYNLEDKFKLQDVYAHEEELKMKHPNNNNIRPKIRQLLQQLRDIGIIKFEEPGQYKKLICFKNFE